jgi:hypothetical protein
VAGDERRLVDEVGANRWAAAEAQVLTVIAPDFFES